jgi:uncharacterized RDD family membrane protein YckC
VTQSDEFLTIDTPENVMFGYEIVGLGSRFIAAIIDTTFIIILQLFLWLGLIAVIALTWGSELGRVSWLAAAVGIFAFLFLWGYYIYFETSWNGQTPGKRWTGIRVIRQDGLPISLSEAVIRNLIRVVDFLPLLYGVGIVAMFADGQSRRLGDWAAGTLVVRELETVTLANLTPKMNGGQHLQYLARQPHIQEIVARLPVERLKTADLRLVQDYLQRRDTLSATTVLEQQLLTDLLTRMEADPLPPHVASAKDTPVLLVAILEKVNSS